jgi:hypothetical protein
MTFTLRRRTCPPLLFYDIPIPSPEEVRYLGLHLDYRLTWYPHTRLKRTNLNRKLSLLRPLLCRRSKLSLDNELTVYKMILLPTSTYAMEVWGSAKAFNIVFIQRFQSKVLWSILDAPWYVSNHTIPYWPKYSCHIRPYQKQIPAMLHSRLSIHSNPLAQTLSSPLHPSCRRNRQDL